MPCDAGCMATFHQTHCVTLQGTTLLANGTVFEESHGIHTVYGKNGEYEGHNQPSNLGTISDITSTANTFHL
jgi:hypothetical protein